MSWVCGGTCACTEGGRSLWERYGMAVTSAARSGRQSSKKGRPTSRGRPRAASQSRQMPTLQDSIPTLQAFLITIFFSLVCACSVVGSVTVSTPFLKFASILSASTPVRNSERSLERAIAALGEVIILLLLLLFVPLLALDRQRAVGELDVDIALVHPRQFRRDLVGFLLFDDVDGWGLAPADLAATERLNVEEATPEWRAPGAQLEVLEQAIDFPPQALERPPLGRTISLLFLSHRQFRCSFSHVASPHVRAPRGWPRRRRGQFSFPMRSPRFPTARRSRPARSR